jgi:UDP-N-acetyl-D-mannosaminuronic acid transferase (WecB/TagA/CpsF family)
VAVDDHSETNKKTRKAIVLRIEDGTEKTIDGADFYVPNGIGLYWMVRHYWRHPDDRVELTDDRALRRLEEGRFDTTVA